MRIVLVGLLVLFGAGAYNYHRNAPMDEELAFRPYRGVADADLAVLAQAYEGELQALHNRYEAFADRSEPETDQPGSKGPVDVRGFERHQRHSERRKALHRQILEREIELATLRSERRIRYEGLDRPWKRILRRVISL